MLRRADRWFGLSALLGVMASASSAHACPSDYTSEETRLLGVASDGTSVVVEARDGQAAFDYNLVVRDASGRRKATLHANLDRETETNSNDRAPTIEGNPATRADLAKLARGMTIHSFDTYAAAPFEAAVMQQFHLAPPSSLHAPGEVLELIAPPDEDGPTDHADEDEAHDSADEPTDPAEASDASGPAAVDVPPVKTDYPLAAPPAAPGFDPVSAMLGALAVASYVLGHRRGFRARR